MEIEFHKYNNRSYGWLCRGYPRSVTLTSESAAKVYDGTPLIRPDVTIGGDGFVNGEVSDVKAIGSALNVSDKDVRNEITFTQKTGYKAENYDIKYEPGTLRITQLLTSNHNHHRAQRFPEIQRSGTICYRL